MIKNTTRLIGGANRMTENAVRAVAGYYSFEIHKEGTNAHQNADHT